MTCTCIIPFYNEGERIIPVLHTLSKTKTVDEIICVDDGSTDNTAVIVTKQFQVRIVKVANNSGKSEAIAEGVKAAKGDIVLLLDADLRNIKASEIDAAVSAMKSQPEIDMIILRRIYAPAVIKINRSDVLITGERLLRKNDLEKIMAKQPHKFELEMAINRYMNQHKKQVYWMPSSAINISKLRKHGFLKGIAKEIETYKNVISYAGLASYLYQVFFFGHRELKPRTR